MKRTARMLGLALAVGLLLNLLSVLVGTGLSSVQAQANPSRVRVAHLSPDAPKVDVYVNGAKTLSNVPFKTVSDYLSVPAGQYRFEVRVAGTPANTPAVIDATATLVAGTDYTVAAINFVANISGLILTDDNSAPAAGQAKVRVLHASPDAPNVDVAVKNGPVLVANLPFGNASGYLSVPAGTYDLEVRAAGTTFVALPLPGTKLEAGKIYTVIAADRLAKITPVVTVLTAVKLVPTDFNVLVLDNLNLTQGGTNIKGRVGAGGNASFASFNLASGASASGDNVIAGGKLTLTGGVVNGNAVYGTSLSRSGTAFKSGSASQLAAVSPDLAALANRLEGIANFWAGLTPNGTTTVLSYGSIKLNGDNATRNVFNVKGSDLAKATILRITAPADSTVIINVSGTSTSLKNAGVVLNGVNRQRVVFNFYEATSLSFEGIALQGTVWAPKASVMFSNGVLRGALFSKSLQGGSVSFDYFPFLSPLPL